MKKLLGNDWFVALLFLLGYLCTNSYIYAWDDQHLEIPLLKHLIDPSLYKGDYYVESLATNFSSFLYPILAKFIKVSQIPAVYLFLFLISRYFMFYWMYRLWQWIAQGDKWAASMAVLFFFLCGRTEEFLYRTFSHQEFAYIFMFGGFYYFYRDRFLLAAFLFGVGANFNAIYNLFPMLYMLVYIIFFRKDRWSTIVKVGITFSIFALPFLIWQIPRSLAQKVGGSLPVSEWMPLYILSCQQNFLFWNYSLADSLKNLAFLIVRLEPYMFLLILYGVLCIFDRSLRQDRKMHTITFVAYSLIVVSFIFTYIYPSRFIIDLNLLRNEQFVRFMLMGYMAIFACRVVRLGRPWQVFLAALFLFTIGFGGITFFVFKFMKYIYVYMALFVLFIWLLFKPQLMWLRKTCIILPLVAVFISFSLYHVQYLQAKNHGMGMWQMYRNWVDMQIYVRNHTSKDAVILTPYDTDTGGFRIFSERKVLVCFRDCGIIGFDYKAALEWNRRVQDVEEFRMLVKKPIERALYNAVAKYKVDYVVFMNYYQPSQENPFLTKIYQNEVLSLYRVNPTGGL